MKRLKILLVTQHYRPEPNFITSDVAKALHQQGCQIKVITAQPNYPYGKIYDGYSSLLPRSSVEDGIQVTRVPFFADHGTRKFKRLFSYLSFTASLFISTPFVMWRPDIVLVYQSPFTTAIAIAWYKLLGARIVYLCADLWPESLLGARVKIHPIIYKMLYKYSMLINQFADRIITSTRGMRERYIMDGYPSNRIYSIPVWVDGLPATQEYSPRTDSQKIFRITYAGNIGPSQGLDVLVKAAIELRDDKRFSFDLYGVGSSLDEVKAMVEKGQLKNFTFHGRVPPDVAFEKLRCSWATFIHLNSSPFFKHTLPSKLAALLASGTIILCGADGELTDLIRKEEAGVIFVPGDHKSLAYAIRKLAAAPSHEVEEIRQRAITLYNNEFSPEILIQKYVETILSTGKDLSQALNDKASQSNVLN